MAHRSPGPWPLSASWSCAASLLRFGAASIALQRKVCAWAAALGWQLYGYGEPSRVSLKLRTAHRDERFGCGKHCELYRTDWLSDIYLKPIAGPVFARDIEEPTRVPCLLHHRGLDGPVVPWSVLAPCGGAHRSPASSLSRAQTLCAFAQTGSLPLVIRDPTTFFLPRAPQSPCRAPVTVR